MRKLLGLLALAGLATTCQPAAPTTSPAAAPPSGPPPVLPAASVPGLFKPGDSLTRADRALLRRCDLGPLWGGSSYDNPPSPVLVGVFGPDHYRFELAIQQAERDPQHPDYYRVRGKCHYRKNVRPFTGWLVLRTLELDTPYERVMDARGLPPPPAGLPADSVSARQDQFFDQTRHYVVRAELRLAEQPAPNSGELRGEARLCFYRTRTGYLGTTLTLMNPGDDLSTTASSRLLRGTRRNVSTRQLKSFVVSDNLLVAAREVYQDFGVGERGSDINPKYQHLGWNEEWENEEWWADSPTPRLGL